MSGRSRVGSHWKKPATHVYDYNYNLGEHYYKPQLLHMERKFHNRAASPPKAQTYAERFAADPVHGQGPRTWRPATEPVGGRPRPTFADDYLRAPPGGDIFSPALEDRSRPRFSLGDRLLDSVGVGRGPSPSGFGRGSSPAGRQGGGINSAGILDDPFSDPFFQRGKKLGRSDGPRSADPDFLSEDPFKSRNFRGGMDAAEDMMDDMLDSSNQVARFRSKLRAKRAAQEELQEGSDDHFGSAMAKLSADRMKSRAKTRLEEIEDEFPSISIRSGRGNEASSLSSRLMNDLESSGSALKSIRISKRSIRVNDED